MLTSSELLLHSIEEYAIIMLNTEGRIQLCNTATEAITGFSYNELHNQPFSVLYSGDDKKDKKNEDELSATLKAGKFSSESWKLKKDGSRYWASMSLSVVYNEQREHAGFAVVIKDITAKKQIEFDFRAREHRYRLMVEGVKEYSIVMLDPKGYVLTWNEGGEKINGYKPYEIIGSHFSVFYTPHEIESGKPDKALEAALNAGKYEEEGWRVRKDGSLFWSAVVITPMFNEFNEFIGYSQVSSDLSERKKELELLRQSEERYRLQVQQVKDYGIFMLDDKGRIISWNEGARKIKGYETNEILGKYFSIFYLEEDKRNERPAFELKIAQHQGKYEEEGWRKRKDGTKFWANVVITAIHNQQGVFLGYSKVTRDLTERREAEMALKESNEKYRLIARQLEQTNSSLINVNKELEEFTSMVSHDLQEPVRSIKSFLLLIEKKMSMPGYDKEELRTYLSKAIKGANRMKELILNLLQYAQLSREEVISEEINVHELIGEVQQNLKNTIDCTGATITVDAEAEYIKGDKVQLMQLIQNLVTNAIKFVDGKKPEIKIHCSNHRDHVLFSVSDNGIGIAKESQAKIFEIFRREHTAKGYPGTGIGLSICKKIVDRHKGKIWPESEPGKGATFYFTLNDNNVVLTGKHA